MANIPHIVYATDDNFAEILGVSLVSLYENSKDVDDIIVYVLDSGISNENIEKLKSLPKKYSRSDLSFIKATDISKELSMNVNLDRGSLSQYARLFVSSVLPAKLDRVLYLDCDIIINKSISELWNLDIKGKTIAALKDAFSKQYRKNIDLEPDDIMFNSGVMLIDLDKWRRENIESKLLEFIRKKNGKIQQGDQGALNAILSKETFCLEPRFNSVTIFYDFSYEEMMVYRKPVDFYPREEIELAVREPSIIHYTTSFLSKRPWYEDCEHRYVAEWFKYKDISPWSDKPLWTEKKKNGIKGLYVSLCNKMPRKLMIGFSGILQAYGRPLVYR
ncbi:MAG: glycosyltransferase family 8 protein [Solobacterium sp.]|nr:glycosyltransferase family 8 protein [Solobacterium sp.]